MKNVTLITGGCRSGKSRYAQEAARSYRSKVFVATAEAIDDEMRERIARHKAERAESFVTVEAPIDPAKAIRALEAVPEVVVLDCLTVWLGNLLHRDGPGAETFPEVNALLDLLAAPPCDLILVGNEVGLGIVPETPLARRFRDLAGFLNQEGAKRANRVVFMVSGLPLLLKQERGN